MTKNVTVRIEITKMSMTMTKTFLPVLLGASVALGVLWGIHSAYADTTPESEVACAPVDGPLVAVVIEDSVPTPQIPEPAMPVAVPAPVVQPVSVPPPTPVSVVVEASAPVVKEKTPVVVKKSRRTRAS